MRTGYFEQDVLQWVVCVEVIVCVLMLKIEVEGSRWCVVTLLLNRRSWDCQYYYFSNYFAGFCLQLMLVINLYNTLDQSVSWQMMITTNIVCMCFAHV